LREKNVCGRQSFPLAFHGFPEMRSGDRDILVVGLRGVDEERLHGAHGAAGFVLLHNQAADLDFTVHAVQAADQQAPLGRVVRGHVFTQGARNGPVLSANEINTSAGT
jgi:hypothetical protein